VAKTICESVYHYPLTECSYRHYFPDGEEKLSSRWRDSFLQHLYEMRDRLLSMT